MEYFIFVRMEYFKYQLQTSKLLRSEIHVIECKNKHEMEWNEAHRWSNKELLRQFQCDLLSH